MKTIVLLSGYAESGKDTVGAHLVSKHGFTRLAFADKLKDEVVAKFHLDRRLLDTPAGKRTIVDQEGVSIRDLLIQHGTERRKNDTRCFVDPIIEEIKEAADPDAKFVITDFRYNNEFMTIHDFFGPTICLRTIRINRFPQPLFESESETKLDSFPFHYTIDNLGSLEDLIDSLDEINLLLL